MELVSAHGDAGLPRKTGLVKRRALPLSSKMLQQPAKVLVKPRSILVALEKIQHFPQGVMVIFEWGMR